VIELKNGGIDRAVEVMSRWANKVTGPTENGTAEAIVKTGVWIAERITGGGNV
jgi:hypothetical protein